MVSVALIFDPLPSAAIQGSLARWQRLWPESRLQRHGPFILFASSPQALVGEALLVGQPVPEQTLPALLEKPLGHLGACQGPFALLAPLGPCYLASSDARGLVPLFKRQLGQSWAISSNPALLLDLAPAKLVPDTLFDCLTLGAPLGNELYFEDIKVLPCGQYWLDGRAYPYPKLQPAEGKDLRPTLPWRMADEGLGDITPPPATRLAKWLLGSSEDGLRRQRLRLNHLEHSTPQALKAELWRWYWLGKAAREGIELYLWSLPHLEPQLTLFPPVPDTAARWSWFRHNLNWQAIKAGLSPSAGAMRLATEHWLFNKAPLT